MQLHSKAFPLTPLSTCTEWLVISGWFFLFLHALFVPVPSTPNMMLPLTERLYIQIRIMQDLTFILNQMLFRCHATTDFSAQFEWTLQTSQANKLCKKHNPIILLIFGTLLHGDHHLKQSLYSVPSQGDLCTITQYRYFPVLTYFREIVHTSYRNYLVWWSYDLLLILTNVLFTEFLSCLLSILINHSSLIACFSTDPF